MKIFSIGHSTRGIEEFIRLLRDAGADSVVDIRRFPHSPRQSHFNIESLPDALAKAGVAYIHMPALGGKRPPRADGIPSQNTLWRPGGFRNYADYAETPAFRVAFAELLDYAHMRKPALMCAEAAWQQCHRCIVTDYLLTAGLQVDHILSGRLEPARLTSGAVVHADGGVLYSSMPLFSYQAVS